MANFIELSIVFDSADNLIAARKALIRADLITSVIDASSENNSVPIFRSAGSSCDGQ